ncbi:FHA modulated ABC efflux pump with fused ATPase and integral membrane subunits domain protein [Mycobacterium xenopi 3993]|nr:FHA modulated ABC efflux pump with fused ATPase and integral membrane subunits domain protein [Mycobacterium xenopi 3993]
MQPQPVGGHVDFDMAQVHRRSRGREAHRAGTSHDTCDSPMRPVTGISPPANTIDTMIATTSIGKICSRSGPATTTPAQPSLRRWPWPPALRRARQHHCPTTPHRGGCTLPGHQNRCQDGGLD